MKLTRAIRPNRVYLNRFHVCTLALAVVITLLPGLVRLQTADAQRAFRGGRAGGIRSGGARAWGMRMRGNAWNYPSMRRRPQAGRGYSTARRFASSNTALRSAYTSPGGQSRRAFNRFVPASSRAYADTPYTYTPAMYTLSGLGWARYFPSRSVCFPNYSLHYTAGVTSFSPYYYYATFPAYISVGYVSFQQPQIAYVPYPVYTAEGRYRGNTGDNAETSSALPQQNNSQDGDRKGADAMPQDLALTAALSDIATAWNRADIHFLSRHVRQDAPIAVYLRGKYFYSLDGLDYLSMTRDAFSATTTVSFILDRVQAKGQGIYTVSGRHIYTDRTGKNHTVLVNYVLKKVEDDYYLIQVGTAPEQLEN